MILLGYFNWVGRSISDHSSEVRTGRSPGLLLSRPPGYSSPDEEKMAVSKTPWKGIDLGFYSYEWRIGGSGFCFFLLLASVYHLVLCSVDEICSWPPRVRLSIPKYFWPSPLTLQLVSLLFTASSLSLPHPGTEVGQTEAP